MAILRMRGLGAKMGQKRKIKGMKSSLALYTIRFVSTSWSNWHFRVLKSDKNSWVIMPNQSWGKSGIITYFGLKIGCFGHIYWDCPLFLLILRSKPLIRSQFDPNWLFYPLKTQFLLFWAQIRNPRTKLFAKSIFTSILKVSDKLI